MAHKYLQMILLCYLIFGFSFTAVAVENDSEEVESDDMHVRLLQRKEEEWHLIHKLGKLTQPVGDALVTTSDAPAFTFTPQGTVVLLDKIYTRYLKVSSATELRRALATAQPGDFIHLLDGTYQGNFVIEKSGLADNGIALYGTRRAVLESTNIKKGYGLHLVTDHWTLFGFTIRNASKGLMMDRANYNIIHGLEIYQIGDEGLHLRRFSSHNLVEKVWIHDVGLNKPQFGEGIYVGSAVSNWPGYTNNKPDGSDHNRILSNLLGPHLTAEGIDIKEGTTGGVVRNNSFLTDQRLMADSWIDIKGNEYTVSHNRGLYEAKSKFRVAVDTLQLVTGWGENNSLSDNQAFIIAELPQTPFFVSEKLTEGGIGEGTKGNYLILVARPMPYTLSELAAYFPNAFQSVGVNMLFVRENILVSEQASLHITIDDAVRVRLLSSAERYVNITGFAGHIVIKGAPEQRLDFESWDPTNGAPDRERSDGRAYIFAAGGRMDVDYAGFFDLGYEEGTVSGVAWKSLTLHGRSILGRGDVTNSHFVRNYFGAYTFEAVEMRWIGNTFADNIGYGFDPHDFSNYFHVENNLAYNNGSHGIIFSRGCDYNVLRGNKSYDNKGHGIMLDDGKVVPTSDNERYWVAVPSNHNIIEDNFVVNNFDGIVLEGGENNIIRSNTIIGPHRYGIRFKDRVINTLVISNTIENSERYAILVYNHSTNNQFQNNTITQAADAIAFQNSPQNRFTDNVATKINGSAIVLKGDVSGSSIISNTFSGSGAHPIYTQQMSGFDQTNLQTINDFSRWRFPPLPAIPYVMLSVWSVIFFVPILMRLRRILHF